MLNVKSICNSIAASLVAVTMAFTAAGIVSVATVSPAEAGKVKIVKKGSKLVLKGIGRVGKKMSKSKVKFVRKTGKGLSKGSRKGTKGIDKASRGVNKMVRKTKTGRKIDNTRRHARNWKTKQLNKAFRNNRGKAGRFAKEAVDLVTPL